MADSIINSRNIVMVATLAGLIGMTPLCSGTAYDFYKADSEGAKTLGLDTSLQTPAISAIMTEYKKTAPSYEPNGTTYFAKTDEKGEFLVLFYPYYGGCGSSCTAARVKVMDAPTASASATNANAGKPEVVYVEDVEGLNCRATTDPTKLLCDHSQGFL